MKKILLDTDIGSDIDDAVCLAYLLREPECELLGITTVSGQARERAMLCDALCRAAGKSVPIYPGTERPLIVENRQPKAPQAEKLSRYPHADGFPAGGAVPFLRDMIRANPHEVTLLAIGPMTNIGLLFATYPETVTLLGGLVLMCGDFLRGGDAMEWNAICDPHACKIVYDAHVAAGGVTGDMALAAGAADDAAGDKGASASGFSAARHRSIGLNVTTRVTMSSAEVSARFTHPVLKVVADFSEVWFRERERLTFHDPLAAVSIFYDDVCTFRRGGVGVELADQARLGRTVFTEEAAANTGGADRAVSPAVCEVASDVNPARFFDRFFSVF
ncbi:MAG: nucleoside hydrolase [Clostridiales bacterium]|jgi:inosine-uridine nucleoside N-ribohydrolase|nr:nucleoside hydrolase [Clostridiales bacterium]